MIGLRLFELKGLDPVIFRKEYVGVNRYDSFELARMISHRERTDIRKRIEEIAKESSVSIAIRTLLMAYEHAFTETEQGKYMEIITEVLGTPELLGLDCQIPILLSAIANACSDWSQISDCTREVARPFLEDQITRGDTFLLDSERMRDTSIRDLAVRIDEIRSTREGSITLPKIKGSRKGPELYDFTSVLRTARGFVALIGEGIGPRLTKDKAEEARSLLIAQNIISEIVVLGTDEVNEPLAREDLFHYDHLFEGFSQNRKNLFNHLIQSCDVHVPTMKYGLENGITTGYSLWESPLERAATSKHPDLLVITAQGFGQVNTGIGVLELREMLKVSDTTVRNAAITALGRIADHDSIPHMLEAIDQSNVEDVKLALEALSNIMGDKSAKAMIELMAKGGKEVRLPFVAELASTRSKLVIPYLIDLMFADPITINNLREDHKIYSGVLGFMTLETFKLRAQYAFPEMKQSAVEALTYLASITNEIDLPGVSEEFKNSETGQFIKLRHSVNKGVISGEVMKVADFSIDALGMCRSPQAMPALVELTKIKEKREHAIRALTNIGLPAFDTLMNILKDSSDAERLMILGFMNNETANEQLIAAIEDKDENVREIACEMLAYRRNPEYVPLLKKIISTASDSLKQRMANALSKSPISEFDEIRNSLPAPRKDML